MKAHIETIEACTFGIMSGIKHTARPTPDGQLQHFLTGIGNTMAYWTADAEADVSEDKAQGLKYVKDQLERKLISDFFTYRAEPFGLDMVALKKRATELMA